MSTIADWQDDAVGKELSPKCTVFAKELYAGSIQNMYRTVTSILQGMFVEHYL